MTDKVLLIRPQNIYGYNNYPPLNLISLGTQLEKAGYKVRIVNCAFEPEPLKTIGIELKSSLFAGISIVTSEVSDAYNLVKFIKEKSNIPVVVGGWHCTLFPEQMAESEYVDYVVAGEGEKHIVNIAGMVQERNPGGKKVFQKEILDLESLPLPDYDIDDNIERFISSYLTDKLSEYVRQPMRWLPYESSRGCPSQCTFCINTVTGNTRYRKKSAEKVISEIDFLIRKYNLTHLKIIDDNFFVDIKRVREICEGIIARKLNITWDGECRCDYFNDRMLNNETLLLCKRSGLVQLTLGIESGSLHTLRIMKKGITPEQAEHAVQKCNEYKIIARSSFIIEIPGENIDDIKKTIVFINRLRRYPYFTCGAGTFRPYPKCELTKKLLEEGYLREPKDFLEWTNKETIDMYTSAEYIRPWQVNGKYSESAAFFLNMESSVRLGNHQIDRAIDRLKNNVFTLLAKARNRFMFYRFSFDKDLYKRFLLNFYKRRQNMEKSGSYPLSKMETHKGQ
ncbi:MAG: radical SAM protein [Syntrophorhabdaceae bacterium]|nr:radical SAM protein [Syntrophorhabdaceae bacterium]MDD5242397.1 radical SAM protein [Syntrophorhabdaceae bacterium]